MDFTTPVTIHNMNLPTNIPSEAQPILDMARNTTPKVCTAANQTIDNCAVPLFNAAEI